MAGHHRHSRRSHKLAPSQSLGSASFLSSFKLLLLLSFLFSLPIAFFYLKPLLSSASFSTIAHLWNSFTSWLTAPLLFLLLNVLVGALVASSGFFTLHHPPGLTPERDWPPRKAAHEGLESHERTLQQQRSNASVSPRAIDVPQRTREHRPQNEQRPQIEQQPAAERVARTKSGKALGKAKADRVPSSLQLPKKPPISKSRSPNESRKPSAKVHPSDVHEVQMQTSHADQESDDVDKRADEYIVQFYQKMKLQRIESFMRNRGPIDSSR